MSYLLEQSGEFCPLPPWGTRDWFSVAGDVDDFIFYEPDGCPEPPDERYLK